MCRRRSRQQTVRIEPCQFHRINPISPFMGDYIKSLVPLPYADPAQNRGTDMVGINPESNDIHVRQVPEEPTMFAGMLRALPLRRG